MGIFKKRAAQANSTTRARFRTDTVPKALTGFYQLIDEAVSTTEAAMRAQYAELQNEWHGPGLVTGSLQGIATVLMVNLERDLALRDCGYFLLMTETKPVYSVQLVGVGKGGMGVIEHRVWCVGETYALYSSRPDALTNAN